MLLRVLTAACLSAICLHATAQSEDHGAHMHHSAPATFTVTDAWSRAMPPTAPTGAVYFTLRNPNGEDDSLIGASTPRAERAELHTHVQQGELMSMKKVDSVNVPANGTLEFAPGGHHVMLFNMTQPLKAGESFPLTLQFEKAGDVTLEVGIRDQAPDAGGAHDHH